MSNAHDSELFLGPWTQVSAAVVEMKWPVPVPERRKSGYWMIQQMLSLMTAENMNPRGQTTGKVQGAGIPINIIQEVGGSPTPDS